MNNRLKAALKYNELGYSVIPIRSDNSKKPLIPWEEYQSKRAVESTIMRWWEQNPEANIGIVTGQISNLIVIDIDDPETAYPELNNIMQLKKLDTPYCKTPSGGYHYWFQCPNPPLRNNARLIPGSDLRGEGGYVLVPISEINGKKYEWINKPTCFSLLPLPEAYIEYVNSKKSKPPHKEQVSKPESDTIEEGTRDDSLFHLALSLANGKCNPELMRKSLVATALYVCDPPFPKSEVAIKVDSAIKRVMNYSFALDEVKDYIMEIKDEFTLNNVYQQFNVFDRKDKKSISQCLRGLVKGGAIEQAGKKEGYFRKVNSLIEPINLLNMDRTSLDLSFPLGLEQYVRILPRNILVVAGEKDTGKSAFCLAFSMLNRQLHLGGKKILYCSSEMGGAELADRLESTDIPMEEWDKRVTFIERAGNFHDVIQPDGITIVDYLELTDNFYIVADYIKQIFEKLRGGICLIALQKKGGVEYGRGGALSAEKARLYVTLGREKSKSIITMLHCKNRATKEINPNGKFCEYKLVAGYKFVKQTNWSE